MLNLYLLEWENLQCEYDVNEGYVIAAECETRARMIANAYSAEEGKIWTDPEQTTIKQIGYARPDQAPAVILVAHKQA